MLVGLVSTIALIVALGPHVQTFQVEDVLPSTVETEAETESPVEPELSQATETAPITVEVEPNEGFVEPALDAETERAPISDQAPEVLPEAIDDVPEQIVDASPPAVVQRGDVPEAEWPAILTQASDALATAKTAKGKFMQSNADGSIATGTFALNRPGRMRFDYDDPTPVLIVSNGTTVAMADEELETVDRVPIGATPLGLILSTDLNVDTDIDVLEILQNEDRIGIRVQDAEGELEGTLTMVFSKLDYALLGWLAVDGNDQTTVVDLIDVETNIRVDPRLFRLDEVEDEEDER
ncbi:MAG: outer-membrane lipoprotein carrier protein LolA [Pseudomonadota bacterium]